MGRFWGFRSKVVSRGKQGGSEGEGRDGAFVIKTAIDMEQEPGSSFSEDNLKAAADALMEMVECSAERAVVATEGLLDVIQDIALPETQPSLGGGGSSNNDLPRKKDDEWKWWKNNGFVRNQRSRGRNR
jgi:hypothetical protein